MMQEKTSGFVPYSKWKPFHKITFTSYEFTVNGNNIEFEERILPEQLGVEEGYKFTVRINEFGRVTLVRE
jgi:hypothetical protein